MATAPPRTTTLRCRSIRPATTAPRPRSAARLNTFEPKTTPAPTVCWWCAIAVIEAVISGVSAASAATMPRLASENPSRSPTRSSRVTSTQLVARLTTAPSTKTATEDPTVKVSAHLDWRLPSGHRARDGQLLGKTQRTHLKVGCIVPAQGHHSESGRRDSNPRPSPWLGVQVRQWRPGQSSELLPRPQTDHPFRLNSTLL